jgi:hypothetical protein
LLAGSVLFSVVLIWFGFACFMLFDGFGAWAVRRHKLERLPLVGFALGGVWLNLQLNATVYVFLLG